MDMSLPHTRARTHTASRSFRRRAITETLTAYAFLAPASILIFVFEFFPVAFAFFVSLHDWRRFPDEFRGLDSYHEALGSAAFVIFFWMAAGILCYGLLALRRYVRDVLNDDRRGLAYLLPGAALAAVTVSVLHYVFVLLPIIMDVVRRLRGQDTNNATFVNEFFNSFTFPQAVAAGNIILLLLPLAAVLTLVMVTVLPLEKRESYLLRAVSLGLIFAGGGLLLRLTLSEIGLAISEARAAGEALPVWTQVILIGVGAVMMGAAAWVWGHAVQAETNRQFWLRGLAVALLVVGGVIFVMELSPALSSGDDDVLHGFSVATMYSLFAVPLQLVIGLLLAVLLFQNIKLKAFYRILFFLPYITPITATSVVFGLLFAPDPLSPMNQFITGLGIEDQKWLLEPKGVFELIFGGGVPEVLVGPSLALMVIILYGVWTFAGYSTVIFLAGLGNIDTEIYEAARIDGANGWQQFRSITLPLLSPTTFFLILITTIGTFQAFTQFFLMRRPGAYQAVNTINLLIFDEVRTTSPDYAYGSAMAFILFAVILILTVVQNRVVGRRVFYG